MLNAKIAFYSMLDNLLSVGVPLTTALGKGMPAKLRSTCVRMQQRLSQGSTFAEALQGEKAFSRLEITLLHAGEATGTLVDAVRTLREHIEQVKTMRADLVRALLYPLFTYYCAIPLLCIVHLASMQFGTGGLSMDGWAAYLIPRLVVGWGAPPLIYFLLVRFLPTLLGTPILGTLLDALPFFGKLQHRHNSAFFWQTFAACISSGLPYSTAIQLAADACPGKFYANRFKKMAPLILDQQFTFSQAFAEVANGRDEAAQYTSIAYTGEVSGRLDDAARQIAKLAQFDAANSITRFSKVAPTILYACLAFYLAYKIISFYASYFNTLMSL